MVSAINSLEKNLTMIVDDNCFNQKHAKLNYSSRILKSWQPSQTQSGSRTFTFNEISCGMGTRIGKHPVTFFDISPHSTKVAYFINHA